MSGLQIRDVSPRDGLQDYARQVSTEDKFRLVQRLYEAGVRWVEATSFVSPKAVPQLADADERRYRRHFHFPCSDRSTDGPRLVPGDNCASMRG